MSKFHNTKIIDLNGKKVVIGSIQDVYNKYGEKNKKKLEKEIGKEILNIFRSDIKDLIKKTLEIKSLKVVKHGNYYETFSEAVDSYILGHYRATIACCGIVCEFIATEISKTISKPSLDSSTVEGLNQYSKLITLYLVGKIDQTVYCRFNSIRKIRNSYVHNLNRKSEKSDAKKCINDLVEIIKIIYKPKK